MKNLLRSVCMAFSMFSSVPMPKVEWKESNMKYMLCALPLVGAVVGAALILWYELCAWLDIGKILYAAGLTVIPLFVSGGIHMDGFCDTADALASHAPAEKKRAILKDSHAGAFAVIYTAAFFITYFALCTALPFSFEHAVFLAVHQVLARAVGALAGTVLPSSSDEGLLSFFKNASAKRAAVILLIWCACCAAGMIALSPVSGIVCVCGGAGCFWYIERMSKREFGGMSGDLAGYIITLSQPVLTACLVFTEKVVSVCF